jgi:CRISPR-associated protein Csm1
VGRRFLVNVTPRLTRQTYLDFKDRVEKLTFVAADGESPPVKPFEIMAYQAEGIKRLGVLRMDVDNLGQIFSTGLGAGANLARVGALSFSMSLFFEGWVEQIAEGLNAEEGAKDLIYAIYSGGDDLFFVGAWHLMPELAERISRDLARYSGFHPGIHLSGGIALAGSKYPGWLPGL